MSSFLIALLALTASPSNGSENRPQAVAASENGGSAENGQKTRSGRELEQAVQQAFKRWMRATDAQAQTAAEEFLGLYAELRQDTQLAPRIRDRLSMQVRNRLALLANQIATHLARNARAPGQPQRLEPPQNPALAQLGMQPGMMGGPRFGQGMGQGGRMGQGGANQAELDNAQALVDLIQQTIAPTTWDINGGPGSIRYWSPGKALVISASDEVHNGVGNVMRQLERANR